MNRHEEIKNAYKNVGGKATFYDRMITCSEYKEPFLTFFMNLRRVLRPGGRFI